MALTPQFRFGTISGVEQVSYSMSRGTQPSVCTVRLPFEASLATRLSRGQVAAMQLSDGVRSIQLSGCVVNDIDVSVDGDGGQTMVVAILDRRWQWRYGQISGSYNVRSGGSIQKGTKKDPRQLATLCLEAMNEREFDVSRMPVDTHPFVDWDLDNPAAMLDSLCQSVNCHVCYCHDDKVRIYRDGQGKDLPDVPSSSSGKGFDFGVRPGKIGMASGLFQWQLDFPLIPFGLDFDGDIKPIEDLSYRQPDFYTKEGKLTGGWLDVVPETMNGMQFKDVIADKFRTSANERKLAKETVWRWYKIGIPKGMTTMPETEQKIQSVRQFFPLLGNQLEFAALSEADKLKLGDSSYDKEFNQRLPNQVWGIFYDESGAGDDCNKADDRLKDFKIDGKHVDLTKLRLNDEGKEVLVYNVIIYPKSFSVDNERQIIVFSDPVYRVKNGQYFPPTIFLRTACNFYDTKTRAGYRLNVQRKINGPINDLVDWQSREDLVPEWYRRSDTATKFNKKEIETGLNYYLDYAAVKYDPKIPGNIEIPWLFPFSPDGRIAQVTYGIDGEGFIGTSINKELEGLETPVTYTERRREQRLQVSQDRLAKLYGKQDDKKGK